MTDAEMIRQAGLIMQAKQKLGNEKELYYAAGLVALFGAYIYYARKKRY